MVNYSGYDVNAGLDTIPGAFLQDGSGNTLLHNDVREVYDISNPVLRKWWVDHCVEMAGYDEIDGIFPDGNIKAITPTYLLSAIGEAKKLATMAAYDTMLEDLNKRMDPSKLNVGNLIRATLPESALEYMHYFDGSYMEGIEGDRDGKIICFCPGFGGDLSALQTDDNGHLILNTDLQDRVDYCLSMFLMVAEEYSYFLLHDGYNVNPGGSALWMTRFAEYDKPLGSPAGPAVREGYRYTREFEHASISLDLSQGKGSIKWDSDSIPDPDPDPDPDPEPVKFSLKFIVGEAYSSRYVSGALVSLDSLKGSTSIAGEQFFLLDSGNYEYTISKPGFFTLDSVANIFSDSVIYLSMQPAMADVKFRVKQDGTPVGYADVSLNGDSLKTSSIGLAYYTDLPVFEDYSYTIGKPGYETVSGNFYLGKDTVIDIQINALTMIQAVVGGNIRIYPLPADKYLVLESDLKMVEIRMLDLNGRLVLSERINSKHIRKEFPDGMPSICILRIIFEDGTEISRKIAGL